MGNYPSISRRRQTGENGKGENYEKQGPHLSLKDNFKLSLSARHIQVLNSSNKELLLITPIIRCHCTVVREGWVKSMTYSYKIKKTTKICMIRLMSNVLSSLYQAGWDPLAPVEMGRQRTKKQTAICFRRRQIIMGSLSRRGTSMDGETSGFSIELYHHNMLVFHSVPNSVLAELVTTASTSTVKGIAGVSRAVFSVISDYSSQRYPCTLLMFQRYQ
jgi:hypothetical protein